MGCVQICSGLCTAKVVQKLRVTRDKIGIIIHVADACYGATVLSLIRAQG